MWTPGDVLITLMLDIGGKKRRAVTTQNLEVFQILYKHEKKNFLIYLDDIRFPGFYLKLCGAFNFKKKLTEYKPNLNRRKLKTNLN